MLNARDCERKQSVVQHSAWIKTTDEFNEAFDVGVCRFVRVIDGPGIACFSRLIS